MPFRWVAFKSAFLIEVRSRALRRSVPKQSSGTSVRDGRSRDQSCSIVASVSISIGIPLRIGYTRLHSLHLKPSSPRSTSGLRHTGQASMALTQPTTTTISAPANGKDYRAPLAMVTTLFFMWGFLTCLNDILVPHLKAIFDLNYAQVMLIQFCFFSAYFVFSIPAGKIIERVGYKVTMVGGLFTMGVGALLFIPAASVPSFPLFLAALIILAAGITALQVSANPYVAVLGPARSAS